jgi:hypothetical protein
LACRRADGEPERATDSTVTAVPHTTASSALRSRVVWRIPANLAVLGGIIGVWRRFASADPRKHSRQTQQATTAQPINTEITSQRGMTLIYRRPILGAVSLAVITLVAVEDVPSSVELRWRPDDHQAAFTDSS